ncbi:MAG: hypothetical protein OXK16_12660 [bacterium]|nr:hypothetical protein [bacterium]
MSVGRGEDSSGLDRELNRGQLASFLVRLWRDVLGQECPSGVVSPFTGIAPDSTNAKDINCLYGLGVASGVSADTYGPGDSAEGV